ncbi:MAG: triose-phosphate isomerase [Alphaproteobacteria bacterium]|nr:triose-phosphate isomerase [Alphaproteobacteria bacterium]MDE2110642.1 triose-phosphate isomerase [Alphaproteobacteria bacterium]MDE2495071.1 triose-phosphate isomerase [Alphaproteobacteria bacterium]
MLIAGNWKMNGLSPALGEVEALVRELKARPVAANVLVCPPATLVSRVAAAASGIIAVGGQDCHPQPSGAFTGDISAEMVRDAGGSWVIVGHSERRQYHGETNTLVAAKASAGWRAGLGVIVCIGETEAERLAGQEEEVVDRQLAASIPDAAGASPTAVAYEPVWAIGTGRTPTTEDIARMHAHLRSQLTKRFGSGARMIPILYGGSVNPRNAKEILAVPEVGGALVGGASLKAADFLAIIHAAPVGS